ncbi:MAG: fructose 1,6-bisphosphatase [Candidatus Lambdaproteobacteria bacterium RIFOXYD1_FULL_56_27]|uniref:Fructose 1,6-bisphosphatase n=1 Tax=Candidatus Lambdaproteobacteria bacterium RIFOXYD2_FULL_56_26 TaxID=1817773 RepID=A0A1F6GZC7_9PROT|nr:MAG: fructose 1,6-bisphosphatase [Candidatus Lambdaproteobacteria bacterium RIFOXYC1_FULL_56_13]OGH03516.1 MAG: fructose 1,6-bisphosphatase [Candidatus Lambdaproteobacteria bacterium RIFOXYD2_FULL_56_26]OGH09639.1 MAG: fructose 1,6-bisphosphatase [Candidatus Lambdaproteobacteria bacterium RIFOXYD1_FULL_56_27]
MNLATQTDLIEELDRLTKRLLEIDSQLDSNLPTTLWISDLHGEGDRFKSILRGRFGMLYQTCKEALPRTFSEPKLQYLVRIIRKQIFFEEPGLRMDRQDVLLCLVDVLKYKLNNVEQDLDRILHPNYRLYVRRMLGGRSVPDPVFEERSIADRFIYHLCGVIREVLLDRIMVLGDIWDRGAQPDKIIRILASKSYQPMVRLVYGNHDILWMGAAAGNQSLVAEAMRITCRYDHFELLKRIDFDITKLADFAQRTYPVESCTGTFKAKTDLGLAMEKALCVIQLKLEDKLLASHPEWDMEGRRSIRLLAKLLAQGEAGELNDHFFPTLDLTDPARLTAEEAEVIEDLTRQFTKNDKLKRLLEFFFVKGNTYYLHHNLLNIHALVPSTQAGDFESFLGHQGKGLLDWIDHSIKRAGAAYLRDQNPESADQDLFFYLWCGPKSPFFGKSAMKTFERYFLTDKDTHKEPSLYWKANLETDAFKAKLLLEFEAKRVIFGHTPVDVTKGKKMASDDGVAINVDGGFAAAYYNRGHALVHTPHMLYGIILPTPEEMKQANLHSESVPLKVEVIDEFDRPMRIRDTSLAQTLLAERAKLLSRVRSLRPEI